VHELPVMRPTADGALTAGNVVTVEPGVYLAGLGGVRIEDLVIVTENGTEVLTHFTKELLTLNYNRPTLAETVSTNQFRNGMHVQQDGQVWRIVEFQHVKPGKGGAFVRTKLKNLDSGAVVERTFRAGEKMPRVHTETKSVQYLYDAGDEVVFMDTDNYEQISLPHGELEAELPFMQPSSAVMLPRVPSSQRPTSG